jgi:RNase P protein component
VVLARPKTTGLPNKEIFHSLKNLWSQADSKIKRIGTNK